MIQLPFQLDLSKELAQLKKTRSLTLVNLGNSTAKSHLIHQIEEKTGYHHVFWASTDEDAEKTEAVAKLFFPGKVMIVPEKISVCEYYDIRSALQDEKGKTLFLFEDIEAVMEQRFASDEILSGEVLSLRQGSTVAVYEIFDRLEKQGYTPAEEAFLRPGEFVRKGDILSIYPIDQSECLRIQLFGETLETIERYDQVGGKVLTSEKEFLLYPCLLPEGGSSFFDILNEWTDKAVFVCDDIEDAVPAEIPMDQITFTTFPKNNEVFFHLNYFSVLPFYTIQDFITDVKDRFRREFQVVIVTKKKDELLGIFKEYELMYTTDLEDETPSTVKLIESGENDFLPHSFQNNERKQLFLTDREIFQFHRSSRQKKAISGMNLDLMTGLKSGDYVIHLDHGLARFDGIVQREIGVDMGTREYLKLSYAEKDKLFVPVESAEKVSKFIGEDEPRLTKLGSNDWQKSQKTLKKEAEKIAGELLKLYAARETAKGYSLAKTDDRLEQFYASFPYELTPGQAQSWHDVATDMDSKKSMDRLVCGDVGFGKTEIAMRAAFKCAVAGYQAAILAPITILAEQHYQNFVERIKDKNYGIRIELLSRFQTAAQQRVILKDVELGLVDIVVGTHRLLSADIKFKNLGLFVIDEEQRFGVKQKEKLKKLKANVDVLTMTATPIPRTLHMGLNKLKDVSTITTPPPGRLPVVTEVRKYNLNLIRERILFELERGGQIYFLHNEVRTIEGLANQLRALIPEAKFIVAHGQLSPHDLEDRIRQFKEGEAQVLIASTIIENGIDLKNANTLIVNKAERFGLSQLYQLRGRVGRSRTQAYAYFLYHGRRLELEAKRRLRAIVEASELGSGFQIAMRDLEIRGAGEILGASQSGAMKNVGVSHFLRLLHKTIEEIKSGEISDTVEEEETISVEIPLSAYIPVTYIPDANEKIQVYKELAAATDEASLDELKRDLKEDYGTLPREVDNLHKVLKLKMLLREANLAGVKVQQSSHKNHEIVLRMGAHFKPDQVFGLLKESKNQWVITATALKLVTENMPVNWYEDLVGEVRMLVVKSGKK